MISRGIKITTDVLGASETQVKNQGLWDLGCPISLPCSPPLLPSPLLCLCLFRGFRSFSPHSFISHLSQWPLSLVGPLLRQTYQTRRMHSPSPKFGIGNHLGMTQMRVLL